MPVDSRRSYFSTRLHISALAFFLVLAVGCSRGDGGPAQRAIGTCGASGAVPSDSFRVALLTPGPISDQSWNSGACAGLLRIRDSIGAAISHIQTKSPADFEENFRQYGAQGYNLVFGHGFEFQDAASRVGPEYPNTVYITSSGNRVGPNVAPMVFGFEDASYLAGVLAGLMTRSNIIGIIGGTELPPVKSSFVAFAAGAKAVNPSAQFPTAYVGNWDDAGTGKELALAQIRRGADLIYQNADAAGLGVFQAARESQDVYVFGTNSNQNGVAPDVVLASVVIDLPHAFLTVAREVKQRKFTPRVIYLGAKSQVVSLVMNPALADRIPPAVRAKVDSVQALLAAGALKAPRLEFVDTAGEVR
jgi:basic membrane protein A